MNPQARCRCSGSRARRVVSLVVLITLLLAGGARNDELNSSSSAPSNCRQENTGRSVRPAVGFALALTVKNPFPIAVVSEPVTSGVPIAREYNLTDLSSLRLLDGSGNPVPCQFTSPARWGGSPGKSSKPVRWLLLDFQADIAPGGRTVYRLVTDGGPQPVFPRLAVTQSASGVTVNTGSETFIIDAGTGLLSWKQGKATLHGRAADKAGRVYTTRNPVKILVLQTGPMRASIQVKGSYRDGSAKLLSFTTRYWFYAGKAGVRVFHTVENNRLSRLAEFEQLACHNIGSSGSVDVADLSLVLATSLRTGLRFALADGASGALTDPLVHYQDSSGTRYWNRYPTLTDWDGNPIDARPRMQAYVAFRGHRTYLAGRRIGSGYQSGGWVTATGAEGSWSVGVRHFWQNFPKALRLDTDGSLEIGLFPDEFGPTGYAFNLRSGEHKTHEIVVAPGVADLRPSLAGLSARASSMWYIGSGAFGSTARSKTSGWPDHEQYIKYQLTTSPDRAGFEHLPSNLLDAINRGDFYGIYDFGDWPIDYEGYMVAPLNCKYDWDWGAWRQWARGADSRWFGIAEYADRHVADIDILHTIRNPRHWGDGIAFGHSYHDEAGLLNPHRNEGGTHPDTAFGMKGLMLLYYLTGYEKARDAAYELANCIEYRLHNDDHLREYFDDSNETGYALMEGMYDAGCRPAANCLSIAVEAYRATGKSKYLAVANALVDWARASKQPYIGGVTGGDGALRPWMLNMYLSSLASYIEMLDEFGFRDAHGARQSYLQYADFLRNHALLGIADIDTGPRAAYPYEWYFDGRLGDPGDEYSTGNNVPSVNNWLLLGADALAYAYGLSGNRQYLDAAAKLFRAGSRDPFFEGDPLCYTETKQTINSITFGQRFLYFFGK